MVSGGREEEEEGVVRHNDCWSLLHHHGANRSVALHGPILFHASYNHAPCETRMFG